MDKVSYALGIGIENVLFVLKTSAKITFFSLKTMLFAEKLLNLCILNKKIKKI